MPRKGASDRRRNLPKRSKATAEEQEESLAAFAAEPTLTADDLIYEVVPDLELGDVFIRMLIRDPSAITSILTDLRGSMQNMTMALVNWCSSSAEVASANSRLRKAKPCVSSYNTASWPATPTRCRPSSLSAIFAVATV